MPTITGTPDPDTITINPFSVSPGVTITNAAVPPLPNYEIYGLAGKDILNGGVGDDILDGGGGDDDINGGSGNDDLFGRAGRDRLDGGLGDDNIEGGAGDDVIKGGGGTDVVAGGIGNDNITTSGSGTYDGGAGTDTIITASTTPETLRGGNGIDTIDLSAIDADITIDLQNAQNSLGKTILGFERVTSDKGNDDLTGTNGANRLTSGSGDDVLSGLAGSDELRGGAGVDELTGGTGADVLTGGADEDVFVFTDSGPSPVADRITDFEDTIDVLDLTQLPGVMSFGDNLFANDSPSPSTDTIVTGDVDRDGVIDFRVVVADGAGVDALNHWGADDFLL